MCRGGGEKEGKGATDGKDRERIRRRDNLGVPKQPLGGPGFDSHCGRPLPTGWVGVSII